MTTLVNRAQSGWVPLKKVLTTIMSMGIRTVTIRMNSERRKTIRSRPKRRSPRDVSLPNMLVRKNFMSMLL